MSEPAFLTVKEVEELHRDGIAAFGCAWFAGSRRFGVRYFPPPECVFHAGGDLFGIAAAYAFHVAQAQAFVDGNKRAAISAALAFLEGNGVSTDAPMPILYDAMIGIAEKRVDRAAPAALFRQLFPQ